MGRVARRISVLMVGGMLALALAIAKSAPAADSDARATFDQFCVKCHNKTARVAGLDLATLDVANPAANAETFEKVIAKLRAGSMPPVGNPRPSIETYRAV